MKSQKNLISKKEKSRAQYRKQRRSSSASWLPAALMILGGMALAVVIALSINPAEAQTLQPARVGSRLSEFTLTDISGQSVHLSDYEGKVVLVNAWATWCPPCRAEMPGLNEYYQQHAGNGFVILAVNAGDAPADASAFAQDYSLAFPVLLDPDLRLLNGLGIHSFPTSIIVGRDGVVKDIHIGLFTPDQIEAKVGRVLNQ